MIVLCPLLFLLFFLFFEFAEDDRKLGKQINYFEKKTTKKKGKKKGAKMKISLQASQRPQK